MKTHFSQKASNLLQIVEDSIQTATVIPNKAKQNKMSPNCAAANQDRLVAGQQDGLEIDWRELEGESTHPQFNSDLVNEDKSDEEFQASLNGLESSQSSSFGQGQDDGDFYDLSSLVIQDARQEEDWFNLNDHDSYEKQDCGNW